MEAINIHIGGNYAHGQHSDAFNFSRVKIQLILQGTFIGQFLKGSNMGPIKKIILHVKFFLIFVSVQAALASCYKT